jgi:hypothetical protein
VASLSNRSLSSAFATAFFVGLAYFLLTSPGQSEYDLLWEIICLGCGGFSAAFFICARPCHVYWTTSFVGRLPKNRAKGPILHSFGAM